MAIPPPYTDQQIADQLTTNGRYWYGNNGDGTIYYSFSASFGDFSASNGNEYALDIVQQNWIRLALGQLSELFDFTFVETAQPANTAANPPIDYIQFANHPNSPTDPNDGGTFSSSYTYVANPGQIAFSNIYFDDTWNSNQSANLSYGSYGYMTMLHEILHSLGLQHPGNYNGTASYQTDALFEQDTHRYTVMSYFNSYEDGSGAVHFDTVSAQFVYARTPMVYDILAMTQGSFNGQFGGYGFNATTRNTDTTYGHNASAGINAAYDFDTYGAPVLTIYDTGGIDTLDLSGDFVANTVTATYDANGVVTALTQVARTETLIDIREGGYSSTHGMTYNIGIAFGTVIENVIGTIFNDTIWGNSANNNLQGRGGNDIIHGGDGDDSLNGGANSDTLYGEAHNDYLNGSTGDDFLYGGTGDDELLGGAGADLLDGGADTDTATYSNSNAAVTINLGTGFTAGGHAVGDTFVSIENLFGSRYDDTLTGDGGANVINGYVGNDTLEGGGGDDTLLGGLGDDILMGDAGADFLNGGTGNDTADYSNSTSAVTVQLNNGGTIAGGYAQGDTVWTENITGSIYDDSLNGNSLKNTINGGDGDDVINTAGNDDILNGGAGNDTLIGGNGADVHNGGADIDVASYVNSNLGVTVNLGTNTASGGYATGDTFFDIENLFGSKFNDNLTGDAGNNNINGYLGDDFLFGGAGNDVLIGSVGSDHLNGGADNDTLTGGSGIDYFVYTGSLFGHDTITDFTNGVDFLDFSASGLIFSDLTITSNGTDTIVALTSDPTQFIELLGVTGLIDANDFV